MAVFPASTRAGRTSAHEPERAAVTHLPRPLLRPGRDSSSRRAGLTRSAGEAALRTEAERISAPFDGPVPSAWRSAAFAARVAAARHHLHPIRSRAGLIESYLREAQTLHRGVAEPGPERIAYAIRLLELRLGVALPAWPRWLDGVDD